MSSYRALKAKEIAVALLGLEERLTQCPSVAGEHAVVVEKLESILARLFAKLEQIAPLAGDPAFHSHVDLEINYISSYLSVIELQFVRALQTPSKEELYLRAMFMRLAERLGLNWFEDMVLHASGKLGIYLELEGSLATPVIHVPGGFLDKVLSLPGIYHEFGHSVFAMFPNIVVEMRNVVQFHFEELRRRLGPTQPQLLAVQLKRFQDAEMFWNDRRLAELFCDLFAQYLCGCANIISMIDLSMAEGRSACEIEDLEYPPDGARVRACAMMLSPNQADEASMQELQDEWEEYAQQFNHPLLYRDACSELLLRTLGQTVFNTLANEMPGLPKCDAPLPDVQDAFVPSKTIRFEDAVQQGFAVLAWRRDNFESWWQDARTRLV